MADWKDGDACDVEITDYHWKWNLAKLVPVPHPGETIREDVFGPLGMSVNQLAKAHFGDVD